MITIISDAVPEYITELIIGNIEEANIIDEDEYYDILHSTIDDWIVGSTGEAKVIVDDFGVLDAIRLYKQEYGEFILDEDDNKVYMCLAYCIIREWFSNYYTFKK
jgi:hypothetical protein